MLILNAYIRYVIHILKLYVFLGEKRNLRGVRKRRRKKEGRREPLLAGIFCCNRESNYSSNHDLSLFLCF